MEPQNSWVSDIFNSNFQKGLEFYLYCMILNIFTSDILCEVLSKDWISYK